MSPSKWDARIRAVTQHVEAARSLLYLRPYSVLSIRSDAAGWVLDEEARALHGIASRLGLRSGINLGLSSLARQCSHFTSQFVLQDPRHFSTRQRISIDYFHGDPSGDAGFAENYAGLKRYGSAITRLRVSHSRMRQLALEAGIDVAKIHRIPIGVDVARFPLRSVAARAAARKRLELPESAVVLGSFQKDGVGWGDGLEPKLIKGPDVFLRVVSALKEAVPELWVLLTGPSRGFIREGLSNAGIPFRHFMTADYSEISACYHALDAYLITARDEGGPKALLEAMASGVPMITTRVGQAIDLARNGENAWVAESENVDGLLAGAIQALNDSDLRARLVASARQTAEANSHEAQLSLWKELFRGYVES